MKIKSGFLILFAVALASSCATVSNVSVSNLNEAEAPRNGSFIYSLPQTVLDVYVEAEEIEIVPGPYARYAQKYLGIKDVPSKAERIFNIKHITLSKHLEADPDFIYSVSGMADPANSPVISGLLKDSMILSSSGFSGNLVRTYTYPGNTGDLLFRDLSIKRNFEAEKDVDISMVMPDSSYQRPSARNIMKEKTLEQKAEEAANFLIKLKKRRFKLVAGQYEFMPDGESMGSALEELSRLEKEYLALFIGRQITTPLARTYHYTPDQEKTSDRVVLFRFSPSEGFIDSRETAGIPVMLELESSNKTKELADIKLPARQLPNTIPCRIADQARIRLLAGEQVWAEALFPVFQYGAPLTLGL